MNVYQVITNRILESLSQGVVPWRCPWTVEAPRNLVSGKEYRGVNVLLLQSMGHASQYWLTFKQARDLGGSVKRGERGCPVVFWKVSDKETIKGETEKSFVLRYFTVFNLSQTEGIEAPPATLRSAFDPLTACEVIAAGYEGGPVVEHDGGRACYLPALDRVQMPARERFNSVGEYYSTLFHELSHSTGAAHRLARKGVVDPIRYASHDYAFEELVAECGAAFLCAQGGIANRTLDNSAAYIASWARKLRSEPRWIVEAAGQAGKAADLILGHAAQTSADGVERAA